MRPNGHTHLKKPTPGVLLKYGWHFGGHHTLIDD